MKRFNGSVLRRFDNHVNERLDEKFSLVQAIKSSKEANATMEDVKSRITNPRACFENSNKSVESCCQYMDNTVLLPEYKIMVKRWNKILL